MSINFNGEIQSELLLAYVLPGLDYDRRRNYFRMESGV